MDDEIAHKTLLTAKETAAYLKISPSTLYRMEKRGDLIPLRTPTGRRRYELKTINDCLKSKSESHQP